MSQLLQFSFFWGTDAAAADSQVITSGNKRPSIAGKSTLIDKKLHCTHVFLVIGDSEQTTPAAKKPCSVPGNLPCVHMRSRVKHLVPSV